MVMIKILAIFLLLLSPMHAALATPSEALKTVKAYIGGKSVSIPKLNAATKEIEECMESITTDKKLLTLAFEVVSDYEHSERYGALFINKATRNGISRRTTEGNEIHLSVAAIMQGIIDHAYTSQRLEDFHKILNNRLFETSSYFPGAVTSPPNPTQSYTAKINACSRQSWGSETMYEKSHTKRPTGCYLPAGCIARVKVPESIVDAGFNIRVGAHSWDLAKKPTMKRLDRVSIVYPITQSETLIGSPLGGGIYIEVPYLTDLGVVEVEITNAVLAPHFSALDFRRTTNEQWREKERVNPAPWADFESNDFMMQVPSSWIRAYNDPESLMKSWDKAMSAVFKLRGLDPQRYDKTLLYLQVDVQMRGTANFPGYPQSNYPYNPHKKESGNKNHWMLKGAEHAPWTVFHELGHAVRITKFRGEVEALVNLMYVAVLNREFGFSLDEAFSLSMGGKSGVSTDDAAITWLMTENFREGREMNYSNRPGDEFKYQHRGYAKYVDIVALFGWEALDGFWRAANEDYMGDRSYFPKNVNRDGVDSRILHMSIAAKADLTPLIHFWGIHPIDAKKLKRDIVEAGIEPSTKILERLKHYLTIIPHGDARLHAQTSKSLRSIIELYFPDAEL